MDLNTQRIAIIRRLTASFAVVGLAASACLTNANAHEPENPNPQLFSKDSRPYGRSMATWAEQASQWVYGQPIERSPLFDQTGANCGVAQRGPVWYIARIAGPKVFSGTRSCTVPHQKAILLYIGAVVDEYPCPALPDWGPTGGQSLYDFLIADAKPVMDSVNLLEVSIDGREMRDALSYRYHSDDLFSITFDSSLKEPLGDPCITGTPQQAIVDGFFMMVRPLNRGMHTIVVHGTATGGDDKTFTYKLNVT
ncbi:hypothetical protein [Kribbella swartbergensis]